MIINNLIRNIDIATYFELITDEYTYNTRPIENPNNINSIINNMKSMKMPIKRNSMKINE